MAQLKLLTQWREDIACVFQRDPAARSRLEVLTIYPGVHAILIHRVASRLWRGRWRYGARVLAFLSRLVTNIDIHPGASIGRRFFIDHGASVVVGETAVIGDDVTLYHGVTLGGTTWNRGRRHPTLGNSVMVGAGAKVLGPISLGNNVRVGANSVVIQSVPSDCTVVGVPGRIVPMPSRGLAKDQDHPVSLNHHLLPDPVGRNLHCLLYRIEMLEKRLADYEQENGQPNKGDGNHYQSTPQPGLINLQ
jgi:serine O-acetyltransferase